MSARRPSILLSVGYFIKRLSYVVVCSLDESVCARVVSADSNVVNMIFLGEVFDGLDKGSSVVGNDFEECAPSTENFFENPFAEGFRGFGAKLAELGVCRKRTTALDDVFVSV